MPTPNKPCGCGFGHKKKCGFGFGNTPVSSFFVKDFTGRADIQNIGGCLEYGVYGNYAGGNNAAPLLRFGSTRKFGNMKMSIPKKSNLGKKKF